MPEQSQARIVPLIDAQRHGDPVGTGRSLETKHVLVETEYGSALRRVVGTDALEYASPVVDDVGKEVDGGVVPRHELAIDPDM
jgi:hypothetical protein